MDTHLKEHIRNFDALMNIIEELRCKGETPTAPEEPVPDDIVLTIPKRDWIDSLAGQDLTDYLEYSQGSKHRVIVQFEALFKEAGQTLNRLTSDAPGFHEAKERHRLLYRSLMLWRIMLGGTEMALAQAEQCQEDEARALYLHYHQYFYCALVPEDFQDPTAEDLSREATRARSRRRFESGLHLVPERDKPTDEPV